MATIERQETVLTVTSSAASKILELMREDTSDEVAVLRVAIQGGGCSGFQYGLGFDRGPVEGDLEFEQHGVRVVVDPFSAPYLQGATVDFVDGLQESGFKIDNPNAVAACGCGHSFQVSDEDAPEAEAGSQSDTACGSGCSH